MGKACFNIGQQGVSTRVWHKVSAFLYLAYLCAVLAGCMLNFV